MLTNLLKQRLFVSIPYCCVRTNSWLSSGKINLDKRAVLSTFWCSTHLRKSSKTIVGVLRIRKWCLDCSILGIKLFQNVTPSQICPSTTMVYRSCWVNCSPPLVQLAPLPFFFLAGFLNFNFSLCFSFWFSFYSPTKNWNFANPARKKRARGKHYEGNLKRVVHRGTIVFALLAKMAKFTAWKTWRNSTSFWDRASIFFVRHLRT